MNAQGETTTCVALDVRTFEQRSDLFSVIYTREYVSQANYILFNFIEQLEQDYLHFTRLFGESLETPIVIRVYPDREYFKCLNGLTSPPSELNFHEHVGTKEIALIGEDLSIGEPEQDARAINGIRHQLALLIVEKITDSNAPPGLIDGVGVYAEDPQIAVEGRRTSSSSGQQTAPDSSWRELWENENAAGPTAFHAMTTVAYMVDAYGWPTFNSFLHSLATAESYRHAVIEVYGVEIVEMQQAWREYYPIFVAGRWRANVVYGFDFSDFEALLDAGAYEDAHQALREAIAFLESVEDVERLTYAQSLLGIAEIGREAGLLAQSSRRQLVERDYEQAIALANQAEAHYQQIGDDRRLAELDSYRAWARETLAMQVQLRELSILIEAGEETKDTVPELLELRSELGAKQHEEDADLIVSLLALIDTRKEEARQQQLLRWVLFAAILLLVRLVLIPVRPPKETRLI